MTIGVVYLSRIRSQSDQESQQRFLDSYRAHAAGVPHRLYIVNKGSPLPLDFQPSGSVPAVDALNIDLPDIGSDLETFARAARLLSEDYLFFLNTHSEILAQDWLRLVWEAYSNQRNPGLVGCTASRETLDPYFSGFPVFPNFHVRTNAFFIARLDFEDLTESRRLNSKIDAYQFESGRHSMTRMLDRAGRTITVVGKRGVIAPKRLWRRSLFRVGNQAELIVGDNQTRRFAALTFSEKLFQTLNTHTFASSLNRSRIRVMISRARKYFRMFGMRGNVYSITKPPRQVGRVEERRPLREVQDSEAKSVVVLIPTHLAELSTYEREFFENNLEKLAGFDVEVIIPASLDKTWWVQYQEQFEQDFLIREVPDSYFGGSRQVNRMGLDPDFYRAFQSYEWMLICHLDAWLCGGDLNGWLGSEFDFIGAPLFLPGGEHDFRRLMFPIGANGGLSLRRISSMIEVLEDFVPSLNLRKALQVGYWLVRNNQLGLVRLLLQFRAEFSRDWRKALWDFEVYEDLAFSAVFPLFGANLSTPRPLQAAKFSLEVNYDTLLKEVLRFNPPFGIHGLDKYGEENFSKFVKKYYRGNPTAVREESSSLRKVISVVMVVKNLINDRRLLSFDQAFESVSRQTYPYLEIVIMDGGSRDGTFEVLKQKYGAIHNVRIFQRQDSGVWEGMNNGSSAATGEFVAFMNSDDYYVDDQALDKLAFALLSNNADFAYGTANLLTPKGVVPFPTNLPSVLNCFGIVHQATLVRRTFLNRLEPFDGSHRTAENFSFVAALVTGQKMVGISDCLVAYRTGGFSEEYYQGTNLSKTVNDFVSYIKKLTTIGNNLTDQAIADLYGFHGLNKGGEYVFLGEILRVGDPKIRALLLQSYFSQILAGGGRLSRFIVRVAFGVPYARLLSFVKKFPRRLGGPT